MANEQQITFNSEKVNTMRTNINTAWSGENGISTVLTTLYNNIDKVVPASWESSAATNFKASYDASIAQFAKSLASSLESFVSKLDVVYNSCAEMDNIYTKKENGTATESEENMYNIIENFGGKYNNNILIKTAEDGTKYIEYTVVANDTLGSIGTNMGVDWKVLQEQNHISNANEISIGQVITYKISDGSGDNQ